MMFETPRFSLGQTVITPTAQAKLDPHDVMQCLRRHAAGDWGECGPEDWQENEFSVKEHLRLFSIYRDRAGTRFWIITEADRSATTILLPEDY